MKQMNVTSKSIVGGKLLTVCAAAHSPNRPLGENRSPGAAYFLALIVGQFGHGDRT